MDWLNKIAKIAENRVKKYGAQYYVFSLFVLLQHPLTYTLEVLSSKLITNFWVRMIPAFLSIIMLMKNFWPDLLKKYTALYWYFFTCISIPFLASYLLFKNNFSTEWLVNFNVGIVISILILDWLSFIILELVGIILGFSLAYLTFNGDFHIPHNDFYPLFFYMLFYIVVLGSIFSKNKEIYNNYLQRAKDELNVSLENLVKIKTIDLELTNEKLGKALSAKTEFLNNMSHEIRTPVNGFMNLADGLSEHWDDIELEEKRTLADKISAQAKRLNSLVTNLLDLTRIDNDKLFLTFHPVSLTDLVENMIDECKLLYLTNKTYDLNLDVSASNDIINVDSEQILQVLRNLYTNAFKFAAENSEISASIYNEEGKVIFKLKDEGVGVPESELEKIFEPFYISSRTKTRSGGCGLGLSICKKIIELHGGQIWAENNEDRGVSIYFSLSSYKNETIKTKILEEKKNIVTIDDEEIILDGVKFIFLKSKYNVICFSDPYEGLEYIKSNSNKISLVLLDLMMPEIYGLDLLKTLKAKKETAHIPVIIQTGISDQEEIEKCLQSGAISYLKKPYTKKMLLQAVDAI